MTPLAGSLVGICPGEETGASLAPACWPDQKPVRPLRTRHSPAASGLHLRPAPELSPSYCWRSLRMLADELDFVVGVDPHRDSHAIAVVEVRTGLVAFEWSVMADSGSAACCRPAMRQGGVRSRSRDAARSGPAPRGSSPITARTGFRSAAAGRAAAPA